MGCEHGTPTESISRRDLVRLSVGAVAASTLLPSLLPQKAFAQPAGQGKLQEVLNRKMLIVGTGSTNPPWHFEDEQGNLIGMDIDLARLVAKDLVPVALQSSQVLQLDSQATVIQALDSNRVDAAAVDQSTVRWLVVRFPDKYKDSGFGWYPQTYAAAVKPGDPVWLNYLNTVLHEAMTAVEFAGYRDSFKKWFGITLKEPSVGFPVEYAYRF